MTSVELKPCNPPQGPYTHSTGQEAPGEVLSAVWLPKARGPDWVVPAAPPAAHLPSGLSKALNDDGDEGCQSRDGTRGCVLPEGTSHSTKPRAARAGPSHGRLGWSAQIPALCTTPELPWKRDEQRGRNSVYTDRRVSREGLAGLLRTRQKE